jgi:hypothetical protein
MKRVKLTRGTVVQRRPAMAGEVFDLDDAAAGHLIAIGKAVEIKPIELSGVHTPDQKPKTPVGLTTETAGALIKGKRRRSG